MFFNFQKKNKLLPKYKMLLYMQWENVERKDYGFEIWTIDNVQTYFYDDSLYYSCVFTEIQLNSLWSS